MIIKKIYYGGHEISSIILNGKVIWSASSGSTHLPLSYDIRLFVDNEAASTITEAIVKEILSGDITVNHEISVESANVNMLPIIPGNLDVENIVEVNGDDVGNALKAVVSNGANFEILYLYTNKKYIAAVSRLGVYVSDHKYHTTPKHSFVVFVASSGDSIIYTTVTARRSLYANTSATVPFDHSNRINIIASYLDTCVVSEAKVGYHRFDTDVAETGVSFGVSISVVPTGYTSNLEVRDTEEYYVTEPNIATLNKRSHLITHEHDDDHGTVATTVFANKKTNTTIVSTIDGGTTIVDSTCADHFITNISVNEPEGCYDLVSVATAAHDDTMVCSGTVFGTVEISSVEGLMDMSVMIGDIPDVYYGISSSISFDHIYMTDVVENEAITSHNSSHATANYVAEHVYHIDASAGISNGHVSDDRDYIYPVLTDTNLYVRQIYAATPSGTNLIFSSNTAD